MAAAFVIVMVAGPLLVVGIVLVVVLSMTRKGESEQPGWQPSPAQGSGVWNAQVFGDGAFGFLGGSFTSTFGRFILEDGHLAFQPDGADVPTWTVPCAQLFFTFNGLVSAAAVELRGPMGEVLCDVSVEHMNRFTRNSFKTFRESRHARGFVNALAANGARGA